MIRKELSDKSKLNKSKNVIEVEYREYLSGQLGAVKKNIQLIPDLNIRWNDKWFPKPSSSSGISSTDALKSYHERYDKYKDKKFAWDISFSCHTGFPNFIKSNDNYGVPKNEQDSIDLAKEWLNNDTNSSMLLGNNKWTDNLKDEPTVVTVSPDKKIQHFHVEFKQYFKNLLVQGSSVVFNFSEGDDRFSITSSFIEIPDDFDYKNKLTPARLSRVENSILDHYIEINKGKNYNLYISNRKEKAFIIPFCGDLHIVSEVYISDKNSTNTWSQFIDRSNGNILGRSFNIIRFSSDTTPPSSRYFKSSQDVIAKRYAFPSGVFESNYICAFMSDGYFESEECLFENGNIFNNRGALYHFIRDEEEIFEKGNVLVHISKTFVFFSNYILPNVISNQSDLRLCKTKISFLCNDNDIFLETGFSPYGPSSNTIFFELSHGETIYEAPENKDIINPILDPEVICHETVHAIMNYINHDFFYHYDEANISFSGAIIEGYANYFANLLDDNKDEFWASYSYSPDTAYLSGVVWGDKFKFNRDTNYLGEDILEDPTTYPFTNNSNPYHEYDVGMLIVRVVWKFKSFLISLGVDEFENFDGFVIDAYLYIRGQTAQIDILSNALVTSVSHNSGRIGEANNLFKLFLALHGMSYVDHNISQINNGARLTVDSSYCIFHLNSNEELSISLVNNSNIGANYTYENDFYMCEFTTYPRIINDIEVNSDEFNIRLNSGYYFFFIKTALSEIEIEII